MSLGGFRLGGFNLGTTAWPSPMVPTGIDPLVAAFAAESGATDLGGLNTLISYVRAEGLINNFVIYPMKSAQNAGSGSTVYGLGGLTTNDMTLLNSPTWGSTGITFNGTNQYGEIADFLGSDTLTVFDRFTIDTPQATDSVIIRQADFGLSQGSWLVTTNDTGAGNISIGRSSNGTTTSSFFEVYFGDDANFDNVDVTLVAQWVDGGGRSLWSNKTSVSLSLASGTTQTSRFNSTAPIHVMARESSGSPAGFIAGLQTAPAFLHGSVTTAQREKITDLINAL